MANELTIIGSLTYIDPNTDRVMTISVPKCIADASKVTSGVQNIGITEEALLLGDITAPTAIMVVNLDPTNFVNVKVGTAGAIFAKLKKDTNSDGNGGFALLSCLGSGAQAPFAIADTGACNVLVIVAQ